MAEPLVTDIPPAALREQLVRLAKALDGETPAKALDRNLLIATWNLREFGAVTKKWLSEKNDRPKRDLFSIRCIAEIVRHFDVVAIQEVQTNIEALRLLLRVLGPEWGLILTDATLGQAGDGERLAFVYDSRRVVPSGLACELVVPDEWLKKGVSNRALDRQFAKTPYAVAFRSAGQTFILVTLHVIFGKRAADRLAELTAIAEWVRRWADDTVDEYSQNLMVLGDFNIDREGDPNYEAFVSKGLRPPAESQGLPRTLPTKSEKPKFFDEIAWFTEEGRAKLTLEYSGRAGFVEWNKHVLPDLTRTEVSFRISDHYPLWSEFLLPPR